MENTNKNNNLHSAKKEKDDEFYTRIEDIENEVKHYKHHFKDQVVFCNCDDPHWSAFFNYFRNNFKVLGLKKLISTHYSKDVENDKEFKLECVECSLGPDGLPITTPIDLKGDGDFRSDECIELLEESTIVCTNPPFSLFREYIAQLIEYDKKFLVIGNTNAITYKETFSLIKSNKLWLGVSPRSMKFHKNIERTETKSVNACWFTNLSHKKRNEKIILWKQYSDEECSTYENFDAIEVNKTNEIPLNFSGYMGVPITFLEKYNPAQFEIVALGIVGSIDFTKNIRMEILDKNGMATGKFTKNAKGTLYKKYNHLKDKKPAAFKDVNTGELYSSLYARIIIKTK